jgi:hypothetical protein
MPTNVQLKTLVGLVVVVLAVVFLVNGISVDPKILNSAFSWAVTIVAFALLLWERWLWGWRIFHPWLTNKPDLRGTWKGVLNSSWVNPDSKQRRGPIEVYLVVRQTYSTLDVRLLSTESNSTSLSASLHVDNVGIWDAAVTYRNIPTVLRREHSPISHGGMLLYVRGAPIHQLDGEYWTDRETKGELVFKSRCNNFAAHDFNHAERLKYQPTT